LRFSVFRLPFLLACALALATYAYAAPVVTTGEDGLNRADGKTTLRDAVAWIATNATGHTVTFDLPDGRVALTGRLDIASIAGSFALEGYNAGRGVLLTAAPGAPEEGLLSFSNVTASVSGMTFSDGCRTTGDGGAVYAVDSTLTFTNCVFAANRAENGGAVRVVRGGRTFFCGVTFTNNTATAAGGAVAAQDAGHVLFVNTTFSGNMAHARASSIDAKADLASMLTLVATTFADNALSSASSDGGSVVHAGENVDLRALDILSVANTGPEPFIRAAGTSGFYGCLFDKTPSCASSANVFSNVLVNVARDDAITPIVRTTRLSGVDQAWYKPRITASHNAFNIVVSNDWNVILWYGLANGSVYDDPLHASDGETEPACGIVRGTWAGVPDPDRLDESLFWLVDQTGTYYEMQFAGAVSSESISRLRFDPGSDATVSPTYLDYDTAFSPPTTAPVPVYSGSEGYVFRGWMLTVDREEMIYNAAGRFVPDGWGYAYADQTLAAAWVNASYFLTVTSEDGTDGGVTLEDAWSYLRANASYLSESERVITFDIATDTLTLAETLVYPAGLPSFAVSGYNNGRGMTLRCTAASLFELAGDGARFSQIAFEGGDAGAGDGGAIRATAGTLTCENAAFRNGRAVNGGAVSLSGTATASFVRCSFRGHAATAYGGAVYASTSGACSISDSVFSDNTAGSRGSAVSAGNVSLVNCTVVGEDVSDAVCASDTSTVSGSLIVSHADAPSVFWEGSTGMVMRVDAVDHLVFRPYVTSDTALTQPYVAGGSDILGAEAVRYDGTDRMACGALRSRPVARVRLPFDDGTVLVYDLPCGTYDGTSIVLEHDWRRFCTFAGWYTDRSFSAVALTDAGGTLVYVPPRAEMTLFQRFRADDPDSDELARVTTLADGDMNVENALTLREAVRNALETYGWRGSTGRRTVRFMLALGETNVTVSAPIEIGSGYSFTIDGEGYDRGVVLSPTNDISTRAFILSSDAPSVSFVNLAFSGCGAADADGGVILSDVPVTISNCAFRACTAKKGGAVCVSSSRGGTLVTHCTFEGNTAAETGGALAFTHPTTLGTIGRVAWSTFLGNAAPSGDSIAVSSVSAMLRIDQALFADGSGVADVLAPGTSIVSPDSSNWIAPAVADRHALIGDAPYHSVIGTVNHAWYRPGADERMLADGDVPTGTDQIGRAPLRAGYGPVLSLWSLVQVFDPNGGRLADGDEAERSVTTDEGVPDAPVPIRNGWQFDGWAYGSPGGTIAFDELGVAQGPESCRSGMYFATWKPSPAAFIVTSTGDGENRPDGKITLRDAIRAAYECPDYCTVVTFAEKGMTHVLESPIAITNTASSELAVLTIAGSGVTLVASGGDHGAFVQTGDGVFSTTDMTFDGFRGSPAVSVGGTYYAVNCAFMSNAAPAGAAVDVSGERACAYAERCTFVGNAATAGCGGAVRVVHADACAIATYSTFSGNTASTDGSALAAESGNLYALACTFAHNKAVQYGTVYAGAASTVGLASDLFYANTAGAKGRSLYAVQSATYRARACTWDDAPIGGSGAVSDDCRTGSAVSDFFGHDGEARYSMVIGVKHLIYAPSSTLDPGAWIWWGGQLGGVAVSDNPNGPYEVWLGNAQQTYTRMNYDQLGADIAQAVRGAVVAASSELRVTTTADNNDAGDGLTSFAEALNAASKGLASPDADGIYRITFADDIYDDTGSAVLSFAADGTTVLALTESSSSHIIVCGPEDGRSLRFDLGRTFVVGAGAGRIRFQNVSFSCSDASCSLPMFTVNGRLELDNCTLADSVHAYNGHWFVGQNAVFIAERCSFHDNSGGYLFAFHGGTFVLAMSSVLGNTAIQSGADDAANGLIAVTGPCLATVAACTINGNAGRYDVFYSAAARGPYDELNEDETYPAGGMPSLIILDTVMQGNRVTGENDLRRDFAVWGAHNKVSAYLYNTLLWSATGSSRMELVNSQKGITETVFAERRIKETLNGVVKAAYPLAQQGAAAGLGHYIVHNEDWTGVAYTATPNNNTAPTYVRGSKYTNMADTRIVTDVAGREIGTLLMPGSYAAVPDAESGTRGSVTVDATDSSASYDSYDGHVSLREAVDYLQKTPRWRDASGNARISFAAAGIYSCPAPGMEISAFTNGILTIAGGTTEKSAVILDGAGAARLAYIAPDNAVQIEHLTITNTVSSSVGTLVDTYAGGAVCNAGTLAVSNCAFRTCSAVAYGHIGFTDGGAIATMSNGVTTIRNSTLVDCSASRGGALFAYPGATVTAVNTTFARNRAVRGYSSRSASGGAVCAEGKSARIRLIGCTIAENASDAFGGGVSHENAADEKYIFPEEDTPLDFVDTLVIGNRCGERMADGVEDVWACGHARFTASYCGVRTMAPGVWTGLDGDNARFWIDDGLSRTNVRVTAVFALTDETGMPLVRESPGTGVRHAYVPLLEGASFESAEFYMTPDASAAYAASNGWYVALWPDDWTAWDADCTLDTDQFGELRTGTFVGATGRSEVSAVAPCAEDVDPLVVTNATVAALEKAVAYACQHPERAKYGIIEVKLAVTEEIVFEDPFVLAAASFRDLTLRISGPAVFRADGCRLFDVGANNRVSFSGITFADGVADDIGGAVYASGSVLTFEDCVFTGNTAKAKNFGRAWGGAVAVETASGRASEASFTRCTFANNVAQSGSVGSGRGQDIYHDDDNLSLYDCTFSSEPHLGDGEQCVGAEPPRVRVEKRDGTQDYFDTVAAALGDCFEGDVLVLLREGCPDIADLELPIGVSVRDGTSAGLYAAPLTVMAASWSKSLSESGLDWYSVVSTDTGVAAVFNESVDPVYGEIDLFSDPADVSVRVEGAKPNLYYGLGASSTPGGPYSVSEWQRADGRGNIGVLTAPRVGSSGAFYRVIVTTEP